MTNYRRKRTQPKDLSKQYRVNKEIVADLVRVLDEENQMLGIFSVAKAIEIAIEKDCDVVEINPKSEPPVVKIIDYNKFAYQQSKSKPKTSATKNETKTLRVSVRVSINDLQVRAKKADEFLEKGMKVKLQVQMRGREKSHPEVAEETMTTFLSLITHEFIYEAEAKLFGDSSFATIKPKA
jgi:translation initiation factor IF-3